MSRMLPQYSTIKFTDVWSRTADFVGDYKDSDLYDAYTDSSGLHLQNSISDTGLTALFSLLYARYGNNPIANRDKEQFKYKIFSVMYQYGPAWEKRLDIQVKLRSLSEPEIRQGSFAMYNQAANPATEPTVASDTEINYINQQNTTRYTKSKLEGYAMLWEILDNDVTEDFIKKFNICFKKFVSSEQPLIYVEENEDDGD